MDSAGQLEALLGSIPKSLQLALNHHAIVSVADYSGTIVYANDLFCRLSGYSREELLGQNHRIVRSGYHDKAFYAQMWQTISSGEVWRGEVKNLTKQGHYYWVASTIVPVFDAQQQITHYLSIRTDITQSKQYAEAAELARGQAMHRQKILEAALKFAQINLYEEMEDGSRGDFLFNSGRQAEFLPLPEWLELIPQQYRAEVAERLQQVGQSVEFEAQLGSSSEPLDWFVQATIDQFRDPESGALKRIGLSRNISVEKRNAQELREKNQALESLHNSNQQMFAVIGHELKTPLIGASMMLADAETVNDPQALGQVKASVDHAIELINQLRSLIQPDELVQTKSRVQVDLPEMMQGIIATQRATFPAGARIHLRIGWLPDRNLIINHTAVRQVVLNLIRNAYIHARSENIWLTIYSQKLPVKPDKQLLTLVVADDGPGVPAAKLARLFQAFYQGDHSSEGTGVGLYVCKSAAKSLGGDLVYHPRAGGGAEFHFSFIAETPEVEVALSRENGASEGVFSGLNILLAEDTPTLRLLTERMLTRQGASVVAVEDGAKALEAALQLPFDLLITDMNMPLMDGAELVARLRNSGYSKPVFGLTAVLTSADEDTLIQAGADAVLHKPLNLGELTEQFKHLEDREFPNPS